MDTIILLHCLMVSCVRSLTLQPRFVQDLGTQASSREHHTTHQCEKLNSSRLHVVVLTMYVAQAGPHGLLGHG